MSRSEGEIVIGRPVDVVSGYVPDQSNEPLHNLRMVRAEKSIAGSAGKGTQFRSAVAPMGRPAEMLIECTACDRPTLFASTTTMQPQATGMSATTLRTSRCPSRRDRRDLRRRSVLGDVHSAGTAPASHRIWISRSREPPQRRSGRSQS